MEKDISDGCRAWLAAGTLPRSLTEALIVLISKCDNPVSVKDSKQIEMCPSQINISKPIYFYPWPHDHKQFFFVAFETTQFEG